MQTIGERKVGGLPTWSAFLARRMAPAMRTCVTTEERQANLSRKLARAANLLRTRVDVALEQQNQDLLQTMNTRTRMQLRLQATVEGLSVAAITYYVVGLFGYLVKGAHDSGVLHYRAELRHRCLRAVRARRDLADRAAHPQSPYRGRDGLASATPHKLRLSSLAFCSSLRLW